MLVRMRRFVLGLGALSLAGVYAACGSDDGGASAVDAGTTPEAGASDASTHPPNDASPFDAATDTGLDAAAGCSPTVVPIAFPLTGPQLARTPNGYAVASRVGSHSLGPAATITVQLIDATGARVGAPTDMAGSSGWQHELVWAKNQLLLAWGPGGGPNGERLTVRRFDANAQPLGAEIPVFAIPGSGVAPGDILLVASGNLVGWLGRKDPPGTLDGVILADDGSYRGPGFRGIASGAGNSLTSNGTSFAYMSVNTMTGTPEIVPFNFDSGALPQVPTTPTGSLGFDGTNYVVFQRDTTTTRMIENRVDPTTGAVVGAANELDPTPVGLSENEGSLGLKSIVNGPNGRVAIAYVAGGTLRVIEVDAARHARTVIARPVVQPDASSDAIHTFDIDYDGDRVVLVSSDEQKAELVFGCPAP
jgi:hypothetical protein